MPGWSNRTRRATLPINWFKISQRVLALINMRVGSDVRTLLNWRGNQMLITLINRNDHRVTSLRGWGGVTGVKGPQSVTGTWKLGVTQGNPGTHHRVMSRGWGDSPIVLLRSLEEQEVSDLRALKPHPIGQVLLDPGRGQLVGLLRLLG